MTTFSLPVSELANRFNLEIKGKPDFCINRIDRLESVVAGSLCFAEKLTAQLPAGLDVVCVVTTPELADKFSIALITRQPRLVFAQIVTYLIGRYPELMPFNRFNGIEFYSKHLWEEEGSSRIHNSAVVAKCVELGENVELGPNVVIDKNVVVGNNTRLIASVYVGSGSVIGSDCVIYPNVTLYSNTRISNRVIIHSGSTIGADGFGYVPSPTGVQKFEQLGNVVIEDDVEIGANCTVDRGALDSTIIKRGSKFDDHVHIAHNVIVGEGCMFAAQTGIAGSAKIGRYCVTGGQAGIIGFIEVGEFSQIGAQSGVTKPIRPKSVVSGFPARDHSEMLKIQAAELRLPKMQAELKELKSRVNLLEDLIKSLTSSN